MKFLNKVLFSLILVNSVNCISLGTQHFNAEEPLMSDYEHIVKTIGRAVESELNFIEISGENSDDYMEILGLVGIVDWTKRGMNFQQKVPILVNKIKNAVKNLTPKQQTIVIDFLHELNSFSSLTLDDLLKIADCSIELLEKALDEYDPNLRDKKENTREKAILRSKKMEKVDLHNEALNLTKKFYSHWSGLLSEDLRIIIGINFNSDQAVLRFQECCNRLVFAVSAVSLTLDDCDLICGTEKPFEVLANIFNLVHSLSSELLEAIEQQ